MLATGSMVRRAERSLTDTVWHLLATASTRWRRPFAFVLRRMVATVALLIGVTLIAFVLTNLVPADPVVANLGVQEASDPVVVQAFKERYGLDKPLPVQYGLFLGRLIHGDLGESEQSHRPVLVDLAEYIPATAELALLAIVLAIVVGVSLGTLAAIRGNSPLDFIIRLWSLVAVSLPNFWIGLLALYLLFYDLRLLPGSGRLDPSLDAPPHITGLYTIDALLSGQFFTAADAFSHLVLPATVLAVHNIGVLVRFSRAAVKEVLGEDYILGARAKGLPESAIVRHILRAAFAPVMTVIGFMLADVMSGTVLVETIFGWPGIGRYAFHAATTLDLPAILGVTMFIVLVFVAVNFTVDVLYSVVDPRLREA